ncbi:inositol monophosphatase family protein [Sphingomonas montanisoli]|uniref:Inositol-1-monophosphatase n=1 Tax=Sphingomonas montanisoli TaxID=2606412 RepID=A0A5D9CHJ1_9SPHN|nr:inositol monophosphatase [Sphingomonas montanisoli]TZG29591.1 inositol-1-monophosphatase [Sphingomonas montanisoli]
MTATAPDESLLAEIENVAVELAQLGGAEIRAALGGMMVVKYKGVEEDPTHFKDPVSQVDGRVEALIRARLAEKFPDHDIVGEEMDHRPGLGHDFLWAVDPIDGTANFINGFPLFASSVGVLYRGRPIVGAVWCSTSHALEPGVYHAAEGHSVRFNGAALETKPNPAIRRRLGGEPRATQQSTLGWDGRKTGSAAIECAFVAAGLFEMAWFERPNIWDVAGGMALCLAAGHDAAEWGDDAWKSFQSFAEPGADAGGWSAALALGKRESVATFTATERP